MNTVPAWRLNLLRACYALMAFGLAAVIWPEILNFAKTPTHQRGVVISMLGALGLLSAFGLLHPLKMLPVLIVEITWKLIWLLRVALPASLAGTADAWITATIFDCLMAVILVIAVPWRFVWRAVTGPAEPWRKQINT